MVASDVARQGLSFTRDPAATAAGADAAFIAVGAPSVRGDARSTDRLYIPRWAKSSRRRRWASSSSPNWPRRRERAGKSGASSAPRAPERAPDADRGRRRSVRRRHGSPRFRRFTTSASMFAPTPRSDGAGVSAAAGRDAARSARRRRIVSVSQAGRMSAAPSPPFGRIAPKEGLRRRAACAPGPAPRDLVLLADTRLVGEPDFYGGRIDAFEEVDRPARGSTTPNRRPAEELSLNRV